MTAVAEYTRSNVRDTRLTVLNRSAVSTPLSCDSRGTDRTGQISTCPASNGFRFTSPKLSPDREIWNTWFEIGNGPNFRLGGSGSGGILDVGDDGFVACSAVSLSTTSAVVSAWVIISKILELVVVNVDANVW